ncbi:MAG: hypothetical protein ABIJ09_02700 [Pseudomonadota bacterium]
MRGARQALEELEEEGSLELVLGCDFAGPCLPSQQRRKILALVARRRADSAYEIGVDGFNARVLKGRTPGWTAHELVEVLVKLRPSVAAFDFPFSIPSSLLASLEFARLVGLERALETWLALNEFVASMLTLQPRLDYSAFKGWRGRDFWLKRQTDVLAGAQPPLKDSYQVLFNMTLLGNALLHELRSRAGYRVLPFDRPGKGPVAVEVYPGLAMRTLGCPSYKRDPKTAIKLMLEFCSHMGVRVEVAPAIVEFCETYDSGRGKTHDPDGSDALIALCLGILHREGLTRALVEDQADPVVAAREGVIWGLVERGEHG